jgi:hypothetical protein
MLSVNKNVTVASLIQLYNTILRVFFKCSEKWKRLGADRICIEYELLKLVTY